MPVYVLGTGVCYPKQHLEKDFIESLEIPVVSTFGSYGGCSVFSQDYISQTKNAVVVHAEKNLADTSTSLIVGAAREALEVASLNATDLGAIFGDTSTPLETTPSEAQRVGRCLEMKVPAYDIGSLHSSLMNMLGSIRDFREDMLPPYVLVGHADTPTRLIDYTAPFSACVFGDAGAGAIVSTSVKSDFIFVDSMRNVNPRLAGAVQIPVLSHLQVAEDTLQAGLQEEATWALSVLSDVNPEMVVCNYLMRPFLEPLLQERLHCASRAESLGTESFIALDYAFKNLEKGQSCAIVSAGVGSCSTIVLFRKE